MSTARKGVGTFLETRLATALGLVSVVGCVGDTDASGWEVERLLLGDTTTVVTLRGQAWEPQTEVTVDLSIGVLDGDPAFLFTDVERLAEDREGGIYVFDRQARSIRRYDRDGAYVGEVGREGQGPGEFQSLSLGMAVDSVGVLYFSDWGNGRVNRYDAAGQALDSWPVAGSLTTAPGRWIYAPRPGRLLLRVREGGREGLLAVEGGSIVDTLWIPRVEALPERRGGPYDVARYWGWHPAGHLVVGVSASYRLEHHRADGVLRFGRRVTPRPVHPDEAAQVRRRFDWMREHPSYQPPEGEWVPNVMPPYAGLVVGDDGRVWVRRNVDPLPTPTTAQPGFPPPVQWSQPHVYDLFDEEGGYLTEVAFPADVEPLLFGNRTIWGVRRGSFDEQYLVRMSLSRGED